MDRPDIEETKRYIKGCCGKPDGTRFCTSFGCSSVLKLISYIEYLEGATKPDDTADKQSDAPARCICPSDLEL